MRSWHRQHATKLTTLLRAGAIALEHCRRCPARLSGEPTEVGWDVGRVARAWAELMHRPGYPRYVARGGDVGAATTKHTRPGEKIIYVLEGPLEYQIEGQPPRTFNADEALTVPSGAVHAVRIVGGDNTEEPSTYVVEKGKPLLSPAE